MYRRLLSLAICKGQIRASATEGDWIFGFGARGTIGERLIYIAQVTDKLFNGQYYATPRFQKRPDRIYEWGNGELRWKEGSKFHQGGSESDIGQPPYKEAAVLLSTEFRYFGGAGTEDYKDKYPTLAAAIYKLGQGHRVNHSPELEKELTALRIATWKNYQNKKLGQPTDSDLTRSCSQIDGSLVRGSC